MTENQKIGCGVVTLLALPLSVLSHALVLMRLWAWFVVPQFGGKPLSVPMALGLTLTVAFLTHQYRKQQWDDDWEMFSHAWALMFAVPLFFWIFGAIVKEFL